MVALKVTIHSPEENYVSSPFLSPLTSQEGVIIVDTEMVPEEKAPPQWRLQSIYSVGCGTPSGLQLPSVSVMENCGYVQPPTYMFVYVTTFYCVPGTVLGKRGRRQVPSPHPGPHRIQGSVGAPTRYINRVSVILCQAGRQAQMRQITN